MTTTDRTHPTRRRGMRLGDITILDIAAVAVALILLWAKLDGWG